jgi:hypothetical protein
MSETANLYPFDADPFEVQFNARPGADNPVIVQHRLRKPTLQELIERENLVEYQRVEISSREEQLQIDEEKANSRLWDRIALSVQGYRGADDWRDLTDEDKAIMRSSHKAMAIRAIYAGFCEVESEDDTISIGADIWTVKHGIGERRDNPDYVVRHVLREPTEAERVKFNRSASSTSHVKGAKKAQVRVRVNLKAHVELYDALIDRVEGATVGRSLFHDSDRAAFVRAIDPIWKRLVVQTLMNELDAQLSD